LRPAAAGLRALYTVIANVLIGVVGAGLVLRQQIRRGRLVPAAAAFGIGQRSVLATGIGFVLRRAGATSRKNVAGLRSRDCTKASWTHWQISKWWREAGSIGRFRPD
jgi:hypothetical protein